MRDSEKYALQPDLQAWILNQQIQKKWISSLATNGGLAGFFSIGASRASSKLTAIQCGSLGGIYLAFVFWDTQKDHDLLVIERWNKDWTFDCLHSGPAIQFFYCLDIPRVDLTRREWTWDAHAATSLHPEVIKLGKPILSGKYICLYDWLEAEQPKLIA